MSATVSPDTTAPISVNGSSVASASTEKLVENAPVATDKPKKAKVLDNVLSKYATYNYILGLGILSKEQCTDPDGTYMKSLKGIPLICKSASIEPSNRIKTKAGAFEFYIDDLHMSSQIGLVQGYNTNVSQLEFKVIEPYSMGMFMQALQLGAKQQKWQSWNQAPFLLTIQFFGNKETGWMGEIPDTCRKLAIQFADISMSVNENGSIYTCKATPYNQIGLSDEYTKLKNDITIAPTKEELTVQAALQTGPKSLQKVINKKLKQLELDKVVEQADEILILFPVDTASSSNSASTEDDQGATTSTSTNSSSGGDVHTKLGTSKTTDNDNLDNWVQKDKVNELGLAELKFNETKKNDAPIGLDNVVYSDGDIFHRGKNPTESAVNEFKFRQDTDIPNAINQVLMQSTYPDKHIKEQDEGMVKWWRIDVQAYPLSEKLNTGTGAYPKLIVYRVVPYEVHGSGFSPPNKRPTTKKIEDNIVKEYNYIYTGKNTEILKFNFTINSGFHTQMVVDNSKFTQDEVNDTNLSDFKKLPIIGNLFGPGGTTSSIFNTITKYVSTVLGSDKLGGGGQETPETRVARSFMDAITKGHDMVNLDAEIIGDPYYINQSGIGNYTATPSSDSTNMTSDGTVNYQNGEVHAKFIFRTPIDFKETSGVYDFGNSAEMVAAFSGMYKVVTVENNFNDGLFKQTLKGYRIPLQDDISTQVEAGSLFGKAVSGLLDVLDPSKLMTDSPSKILQEVVDTISTDGSKLVDGLGNMVDGAKTAISDVATNVFGSK